MAAFSASRSILKAAAAAAGRCHLSTVAVPKKNQNIIHMDQFMTRADLLLLKKKQQSNAVVAAAATTTVSSSMPDAYTAATTTHAQQQAPPLQRGGTDAQIMAAGTMALK
mmetsp:Transcript_33193/g.80539  ORF Transcript_33193/g.80539 Transcript_33193/m.80539 type:complete len:110 (-) Transcript_33193:80-409(-)